MTRISSSIPRRRPPARLRAIYAFVQPFLTNYKKMLAFVSIGVVVETLFNVIMPLSLKFLIDDALGEEDFQALYMILGVLAVAGIITSIVAIWYERWDAQARVMHYRRRTSPPVRPCAGFAVGVISRGPSAARYCRGFASTFRPSKIRSRPLPTARHCRSWN